MNVPENEYTRHAVAVAQTAGLRYFYATITNRLRYTEQWEFQ